MAIASVILGAIAGGKAYVIVSFIVVTCTIVPFFVQFERRRPQARELVTVAVMCALAVASRAAFIWLPNFKPMAAIIMIAGVALGPSSGFLVGSVSMLASNFIFGQGPWTPWQMLAYGLCGLAAGGVAKRGHLSRQGFTGWRLLAFCVAGACFVVFIAGPILDTSSIFYVFSNVTVEGLAAVYLAGLPINCMQGVATFLTLLLLSNPLLGMLARLREKYGMF